MISALIFYPNRLFFIFEMSMPNLYLKMLRKWLFAKHFHQVIDQNDFLQEGE